MSHYVIQKLIDFDFILNDEITLFGNTNSIKEEIYHNMWIIDIDNDFAKKITLPDLSKFLTELLENRSQQVQEKYPTLKATFYLWYDAQSVQLRFNILSGENIRPPFGCSINILESPLPILQTFLDDIQRDPHPLDFQNFKFLEPGDPGWDEFDEDEPEEDISKQTIDVYVTTLPQPTFPCPA
jgi:hypothetical protein